MIRYSTTIVAGKPVHLNLNDCQVISPCSSVLIHVANTQEIDFMVMVTLTLGQACLLDNPCMAREKD